MFSLWEVWGIVVFSGSIRDNNQPIKKMSKHYQYKHGTDSHGRPLAITSIWTTKSFSGREVYLWANRCGEGEEDTFEAAVLAAKGALTPPDEVANNGQGGDQRIIIWKNPVTGVRHAETNWDNFWEEEDLEGFLLLLAECGIIEAGVRVVHTDDEYNEHLGTVLEIDGDLARIVFKDGQEGWERLDSLYAATAKDVLRFA